MRPWIALVIVVLIVFGPVIGHEFLDYDDSINITTNPKVTSFSLAGLFSFWQQPYLNLYIPLTYNLWAVLAKASSLLPGAAPGQPNPALFHGANLVLHLACAGFILGLLLEIFRSPWAAWFGAALFAIHPVQVEPVAWATGMKDVLSGFFSLCALWLYVRYVSRGSEARGRWWWYWGAAISFLLAMLSKPGAVATPVLAWLVAVLLLGRRPFKALLEVAPWLVLAAPVIIVTRLAQAEPHNVFEPIFWQRLLVAGDSISFYLGKVLLPLALGPDYGRTPKLVLDRGVAAYLTGLLPYLLAVFLWWKGSRPGQAAAGIFVVVLLPVSGLVPFVFQQISTVADRYLYLAMLGPALALAWALATHRSQALWGGAVLALALLGARSMEQLRVWHEPNVFYEHALKINPQSWTSYNNFGNFLADTGRPLEAIAAYEKAIAIDPGYAEAYNNLGTVRAAIKQWDGAVNAFTKAMELNPYYVDAAVNLGDAYRMMKYNEEAIGAYQFAIASGAPPVKVYYNLCTLYHELERNEEAASCYNKLLAIKPDSAESYNNLGTVYKALNRDADAIEAYQKALSLRPQFAEVYNNLGFLYAAGNKFAEAIPYYQKAAELYPGHTMPLRNLALAYLGLGQDQEAIVWLEKAIGVDPGFAPAYNDLSRLYLARGDYGQAVAFGRRARELGLVDVDHWQALAPYLNQPEARRTP